MDQARRQTAKISKRSSSSIGSPIDADIPVKKGSFDQPSFSVGSPIDADIPMSESRFDQPSTSTGGDANRTSKSCSAFDMRSVKEKLENFATSGSGLKHNMHGPEFQLGMLMLVLWRAYVHGYHNFGLATELEEAEKFDDIVFQSRRNDKEKLILRLIQAKHKEGKTITLVDRANLLAEDDKDFALQKYYHSFIKIQRRCLQKSRYCPFSGAEIKDVLLVTNTDLKTLELRNSFEEDKVNNMKNDELLKLDSMPNTVKYKLSASLIPDLMPILERTSEFNQLVHTLAKSIVKNEQLNKNIAIIMEFIHPLRSDVFNCEKKDGKHVLKFSKAFFDTNHSSSELSKFREALAKEITFLKKSDPKLDIKEFRKILMGKIVSPDEIKEAESQLKEAEIEVSNDLAKCMQFVANPTLEKPVEFARQFVKMLPSSDSPPDVEINESSLQSDAVKTFSQNICVLGKSNVFVRKFKKIRLSTKFFESAKLLGNLEEFRKELIAKLGKDKFDMIFKFKAPPKRSILLINVIYQ